MTYPDTGTLRDRIKIQARNKTTDGFGQSVISWTDYATVWANVRFKSGMEFIRSDKEVASVTASARIRWRGDITPQMRVVLNSVNYNIQAVLPDSGKQFMDLVLEAGVSDGR